MVRVKIQELEEKFKKTSRKDLFTLDEKSSKLISDMNHQYQSYKKDGLKKRKLAKHHCSAV